MKSTYKADPKSPKPWMLATLLLGLMTAPSFGDGRDCDGADIFPVNSHPYGKTYGQWAVAWWQWAVGIPLARNPWANDTTGQFAAVGQSGPVWFLGSNADPNAHLDRRLTIPHGKAIFMPVIPFAFGSGVFDCDPTNPGVPCDVPTLRGEAAAVTEAVQTLEVSVDGEPVRHVQSYRAQSPGAFSITTPADSVTGITGTFRPQVADGYWLLFEPLEPGKHTIRVRVFSPGAVLPVTGNPNPQYAADFQVTYHIEIKGDGERDNERDH